MDKYKELKNDYYLASIAFLVAGLGLIITRLFFGIGLFDKLPPILADFFGSIMIQIIFIAGGGLTVMVIQQKFARKRLSLQKFPNITETEAPKTRTIKERFVDIGFKLPSLYILPLSIIMGILFFIMTMGVSYINQIILLLFKFNFPTGAEEPTGTVWLFLFAIFNTAILPGICEEFLHRGIILKGLKNTMREKYAIIISAILFGLMHANIRQTLYTFVGGIIFAILAVKTRSIYPSMIMHFINNAISVYATHAYANGWFGWQFESFLVNNLALSAFLWLICSVILVVILVLIVKLEQQRQKIKNLVMYNFQGKPQEVFADINNNPQINTTMPNNFFGATPSVVYMQFSPLYKPKFEDKVIMKVTVFLLALATIITFYQGLF